MFSSSSSDKPLDPAKEEAQTIQTYRTFIRGCKSTRYSSEATSSTQSKEVVSESFVDTLSKQEIDEIGKKMFSYWEKRTKTEGKLEGNAEDSKVAAHRVSDPKIQHGEALPPSEGATSEVPLSAPSHRDIGELIESELRSLREAKLAGGEVVDNLRGGENVDFTDREKKAAEEANRRRLPIINKTDSLSILITIYDCTSLDSVRTSTSGDAMETTDVLDKKSGKEQEFRKRLVVEMKIVYARLCNPRERVPSSFEESGLGSYPDHRNLAFSPRDPSLPSLPEDFKESAGIPRDDISGPSSKSGLQNPLEFYFPADGQQLPMSEVSEASSLAVYLSDDTLDDISSIAIDTRNTSVSTLGDVDALASPLSKDPPKIVLEKEIDDDVFPTVPLYPGQTGTSNLVVPQDLMLPSSLDNSSENAEAEYNDRRRRERSPKEDENEQATKRKAT